MFSELLVPMLGFNVVKVDVVDGNTTNGWAEMDFDLNNADVDTALAPVASVTHSAGTVIEAVLEDLQSLSGLNFFGHKILNVENVINTSTVLTTAKSVARTLMSRLVHCCLL